MIQAAVLTVLIETFLFFLYGYRQKMFLAVVALANLVTNVTLNLAVFVTALLCARSILPGYAFYIIIAFGEAAAVAAEYIIFEKYLRDSDNAKYHNRKRLLFIQTLSTNAVSFTAGLLLTFLSNK